MESRAGFMALKEQQKLVKELTGYVEWICRAGKGVQRKTDSDYYLVWKLLFVPDGPLSSPTRHYVNVGLQARMSGGSADGQTLAKSAWSAAGQPWRFIPEKKEV